MPNKKYKTSLQLKEEKPYYEMQSLNFILGTGIDKIKAEKARIQRDKDLKKRYAAARAEGKIALPTKPKP